MLDQISRTDESGQSDSAIPEGSQQTPERSIAELFSELNRAASKRRLAQIGYCAPRLSNTPPPNEDPAVAEMRRTELAMFEALVSQTPETEGDMLLQFRALFHFYKLPGSEEPYLRALEKTLDEFHRAQLEKALERVTSPYDSRIQELLSTSGQWSEPELCEMVGLERTYDNWKDKALYPHDECDPTENDVLTWKSMELLWEIGTAIDEAPLVSQSGAAAKLQHLIFLDETGGCNPEDVVAGMKEVADFLGRHAAENLPAKASQRQFKKAA